jgi:hypothetical protein
LAQPPQLALFVCGSTQLPLQSIGDVAGQFEVQANVVALGAQYGVLPLQDVPHLPQFGVLASEVGHPVPASAQSSKFAAH